MLTAWGAASAFGPLLFAYTLKATGAYSSGLHIIAGIMAVSTLLPILVRPPRAQNEPHAPESKADEFHHRMAS
jgi:OFA family oxalate/formate antiporter-like MFS transporter